jgi:zinc protease
MSATGEIGSKNPHAYLLFFFLLFFLLPGSAFSADAIAEREVLPNGMTLLHSEKKALPLIKVVVAIKAGSVVEPSDKAGLANLTAVLLSEGTMRRSSGEISDEIEFVGGSLSVSGGADYITVSLSVLKKDRELGFDLLADIIMNPAFSEGEIKRRKDIIKSSIMRQKEEPGAVASKAFLNAVYGKHPYGRPVEGVEESLDRITRQDIVDFHTMYYAPNNAIMAVVGDINRQELHALIAKYFKGWQKRDVPVTPLSLPQPGAGPSVVKIQKEITQANIVLGRIGIKREDPDYYATLIMNYILGGGGFASRLMDNIRDNKGLAYDVHSAFSTNKYAGDFRVVLQTKNSTADLAIDEIFREVERIKSEPVSDKELNDAKSYLTGSFPLRIDSNDKMAGFLITIEYYKLGLDYISAYNKSVNSVSKEDVLRAAKKYLNMKGYVLAVVGDLEKASLKY